MSLTATAYIQGRHPKLSGELDRSATWRRLHSKMRRRIHPRCCSVHTVRQMEDVSREFWNLRSPEVVSKNKEIDQQCTKVGQKMPSTSTMTGVELPLINMPKNPAVRRERSKRSMPWGTHVPNIFPTHIPIIPYIFPIYIPYIFP